MVVTARLPKDTVRVAVSDASRFVPDVSPAAGCPLDHAGLVADVLVTADLRGVRSLGVEVPW